PWEATVGLSPDEAQRAFDRLTGQGYRLLSLSGCWDGAGVRHEGIYARDGRDGQLARLVAGVAACRERRKQLEARKFRPVQVKGFFDGKGPQFGLLAEPDDGTPYRVGLELTPLQYQEFLDEGKANGYRPVSVTTFPTGAGVRFAAILLRDNPRLEWVAKHGLL